MKGTLVDSVRVEGCPGDPVRVGCYIKGFSQSRVFYCWIQLELSITLGESVRAEVILGCPVRTDFYIGVSG